MPAAMIKKKTPNQRRRASAGLTGMEQTITARFFFQRQLQPALAAHLDTPTKVRRERASVAELENSANPQPGKAALRSARFPACGFWRLSSRQMVVLSRSSLFSKASFHKSYSQRFGIWRTDQFEHVGTMLLDLSKVVLGIIDRMGATHRANNLQPPMSQAAQGTGVALSFVAVGPIEGRRPSAIMAAQVGPQVQCCPQWVGAGPADFDPPDFSALISNRSRSRAGLNLAELAPVSPSQFGQQPRCQFGPGPGQRAKQIVVRVLVEQSWDACTVVSQLLLQGLQQSGQALDQQTLSSGDRLRTAKGRSPGENFHPLRRGLWTPQFVAVKELLPFTLTGRRQRLGRGKGQHKGPSVRGGPVIESFQCRRVILLESGLELVDQGSALLNQCDFIPTESAQLARQGIQRRESAPALSVGAQRIGQTPSVVPIILAAGGPFAFAVACSRLGHDRINPKASLEQLIDGGAGAGLDGHGQTGPSGQGLLSLLPAFGVVGEGQLQCDLPLGIDHDQIVVIVGPIQGREVRQFSPCFHWFGASGIEGQLRGAVAI